MKLNIDKYWINQDIVFDYTADLTGTGDRNGKINTYGYSRLLVVLHRVPHPLPLPVV